MSRDISVALVSRSNAPGGGASRIAEELACWLHNAGSEVTHYCASAIGTLKRFQASLYSSAFAKQSATFGHRCTRSLGLNDLIPVEFFTSLLGIIKAFDIVHFHDLHTAISPLTLRLCSTSTGVVVTGHDCSSFTGGCVYPLKCERFHDKCGHCPQLPALGARFDFTKTNLRVNRWLAGHKEIQYVFPSRWICEKATRSLNFAREPKIIHNGFSNVNYEFQSKSDSRRKLGLRDETRVILVAAHYLADPRKGVGFALSAIKDVADLSPLVIFVGIPPADIEPSLLGVRFWLTGFVGDQRRLGLLFAAADVFLFTSIEDNLPIMVQESLAAGTPVVGFAAGGVSEMVDHGESGWLCAPEDQFGLSINLRSALTQGDLTQHGNAGRKTVRERFDMDSFGERHLALYEEVAK